MTTCGVYVAAGDAASLKATIALGLTELLSRRVGSVGVFRPVVRRGVRDDLVETLRSRFKLTCAYDDCIGVTYDDLHADREAAVREIERRYRRLAARCAAVVVVGADHSDVGEPAPAGFDAAVGALLGVPVICVVNGLERTPRQTAEAVDLTVKETRGEGAEPLAVVVTRVPPGRLEEVRAACVRSDDLPVYALPEVPRLERPTISALMDACGGYLMLGEEHQLGREASGLMVGAMTLPNILNRLTDGVAVLIPSDRAAALLPGLLTAHAAPTFPALSGIIMTGGMELPESVARLLDGMSVRLPVIITEGDTFETATRLSAATGRRFTPDAHGKIETALGLFADHIDGAELARRLGVRRRSAVTPLMFEYELLERARADRRRIVLPEGDEPRVLHAADILLRRGIADLTLLGDEETIRTEAAELGLDVSAARVVSPFDRELRERFAVEYARLRKHRGVTYRLARDLVTDVQYFGALMVHLGLADGMVSGAVHTTAHTVRPALEIVKTAPGAGIVSSVHLVCLSDRVLVYGDCLVVPSPDPQRLAAIALSAAGTARRFGIDPRVAILSRPDGPDDDAERSRAVEIVRERAPGLAVEGPVAHDDVAAEATVYAVPDLDIGDALVRRRRAAGASVIGPVLQGLRRPVNALPPRATVQDIVNAVAITAIQAQPAPAVPDQPARPFS
ncbi:phosphate acetyltransferase [Thermomonospora catenispora]|uniref:phosphate acetyltransferase n=1 Tax=Thermomonospora catenispora TaxID=2493090 RepID=UPI00111D2965|nr:phosphate acetyltransferase [Thermomonospora catenispora]TNY35825.1 phosphate acetyltransferase [Thermomonospora catenispora]